jgi:precorrin-6B methylase 2
VDEMLEARRFARQHSITSDRLRRYRLAKRSHLDLLPAGVRLDEGLVVDVGANVGAWTGAVLAIAPDARVLAIEPAEAPREQLLTRFG